MSIKKLHQIASALPGILLVLLSASVTLAADASFSWLPNTESNLAGYRIHYGQSSRNYDSAVDVGLAAPEADGRVHYTVTGLTAGTTYYFAATAYDTDGQESEYSTEVVWTAPDDAGGGAIPVAEMAASPASGSAPLEVNFDGSGSMDPDGQTLTYIWNFGDGSSATTLTAQTSHIYSVAGEYTATLKIDDGTDVSAEVGLTITVTPATSGGSGTSSPVAVIEADRTSGAAPLAVSFDGSGSTSSTANGAIVQYAWSFGDGSTGTGATLQHTYTTAGTYTVTLTVTDDASRHVATTMTITATADTGGSTTLPPTGGTSDQHAAPSRPNLLPIYKLLLLK
ncbi:PKD domain-containing protein [Thermodesulfobacteriota bacterium B35]